MNSKDVAGGERITQFGRALAELNIDIICANIPQAKGRVERAFGTLQDPHFPRADALTMLTAVAVRTSKIRLGTAWSRSCGSQHR